MSIETQFPLACPLIVNGKEGSASSGKQFNRENPADNRIIVTVTEEGTASDMRAAIFGMFRNAGQACGATTRLLVQESIHDSLLERVVALAKAIEVGEPARQSTDMGPLVSKSQENTVQQYINVGLDSGFPLVTGSNKLEGDGFDHGYYVEPTILDNVDNSSALG